MANLYHIINPVNETWMCVNENFTTKRKYALMFTKRGAEKMVEKYPNLIVRVWGWSGYFVELDECYQDHIIKRMELAVE